MYNLRQSKYGNMCRGWRLKRLGPWSSLGSHGLTLWNNRDHEAVHVYKYVKKMETVKQSEPWSNLGRHGYYVFTLVDVDFEISPDTPQCGCVFILMLKSGILKFWFQVIFDLEGHSQLPPKTIGILTKVICTCGPKLAILAWIGHSLLLG